MAENKTKKAAPARGEQHKRHMRTYGEMLAIEKQREKEGLKPKWSVYAPKSTVQKQRANVDPIFLILLCMLVGTGLLMMFSASYANATYYEGDSMYYIRRQVIFSCLGFVLLFIASRFNYKFYKKFPLPRSWMSIPFWQKVSASFPYVLYTFTLVLLAITLVMPERNFSHRWIIIGPLSFQPSDLMKFCIILQFAAYVDKHYKDIKAHSFKNGVLYYIWFFLPVALIMLNQTHVSGTIIIFMITMVMMMLGGTKLRYFFMLIPLAAAGIAGIVIVKGVGYVETRLNGWIDPLSDISEGTWQTVQSLVCIATGGFWGKGFGNSSQKYLFLPEPQNDFIFAIICEELGLIGAFVIMMMFALLIWRGYTIAKRAKDRFGFMLCAGIISQIALQVILNIAVVSNAMPNTGISLPFFSYGGTSLCILMAEMGVVLNISRSANMMKNG